MVTRIRPAYAPIHLRRPIPARNNYRLLGSPSYRRG
jgi:hypothetical protein